MYYKFLMFFIIYFLFYKMFFEYIFVNDNIVFGYIYVGKYLYLVNFYCQSFEIFLINVYKFYYQQYIMYMRFFIFFLKVNFQKWNCLLSNMFLKGVNVLLIYFFYKLKQFLYFR